MLMLFIPDFYNLKWPSKSSGNNFLGIEVISFMGKKIFLKMLMIQFIFVS